MLLLREPLNVRIQFLTILKRNRRALFVDHRRSPVVVEGRFVLFQMFVAVANVEQTLAQILMVEQERLLAYEQASQFIRQREVITVPCAMHFAQERERVQRGGMFGREVRFSNDQTSGVVLESLVVVELDETDEADPLQVPRDLTMVARKVLFVDRQRSFVRTERFVVLALSAQAAANEAEYAGDV